MGKGRWSDESALWIATGGLLWPTAVSGDDEGEASSGQGGAAGYVWLVLISLILAGAVYHACLYPQ